MRTIHEAKAMIEKAMEVIRSHSDGRAVDVESRVDFQRGRSNNTDYLDWACWFLGWGDKLPPRYHVPWLGYIGRIPWHGGMERLADDAIARFAEMVPHELWEQGSKIEI